MVSNSLWDIDKKIKVLLNHSGIHNALLGEITSLTLCQEKQNFCNSNYDSEPLSGWKFQTYLTILVDSCEIAT